MASKALANQVVEPRFPRGRRLLVVVDNDQPVEVDENEWAADNEDDLHLVADVEAMVEGETGRWGGGAAPIVKITVLA